MKLISILKLCFTVLCLVAYIPVKAYDYHFKSIESRFDNIAKTLNQMDYNNMRERITESELGELDRIAKESGNPQLKARALYWRVRSSQMSALPPKCIELLEEARKLCSEQYAYDLACIEYQLAGNYERMGQYLKAYNLLNSTFTSFEEEKDYYFLGNAYLLLAQLFMDINDPENAREPLKKSKEAYQKALFPLNRIYYFEAALANENEKLKLYKLSLKTGGVEDWGMTLQALNNISTIFINKNMPDSAEVYNNMAFDILKRKAPGNELFKTLITISKVHVLYAQKRYNEAMDLLRVEESKKEMLQGERFLAEIYQYLWRVNDALGNESEAYKYLKLYMDEYQQDEEEIKRQDIPKARAREAIARRNDTIKLLEQDAQLSRSFMYVMILVTIVVVLVCVVLFIYFYQRYKIRKIENRELRNSLRQEALIYSVNRKNFEQDMKQKDCEISSSTLLLANKNEVLQQISAITKRYSEEGRIPIEYVNQINGVIGDSLKNDDEWERFKLHFDSVHPDFFVNLKAASSELTENDLRLCAYISIGMRAKQIAEMLSVSPDSINSNRYRLRKKLGLQRGESLDDFIRKI